MDEVGGMNMIKSEEMIGRKEKDLRKKEEIIGNILGWIVRYVEDIEDGIDEIGKEEIESEKEVSNKIKVM